MDLTLSLDDYIKWHKAADAVTLLDIRKKQKTTVDKEILDSELDDYMASVQSCPSSKCNIIKPKPAVSEDIEMPTQKSNKSPIKFESNDSKHKSQQWRMGANAGRPQVSGRVGKNYRKNQGNNSGKYIEQGNFTFKYQNGEGNRVSGIVRNQRFHPQNPRRNYHATKPYSVVKIPLKDELRNFFTQPHVPQLVSYVQQSASQEIDDMEEDEFTLEVNL